MSKTVAGVMSRSKVSLRCWAVFSKGRRSLNFSRVVWTRALTPKIPWGGHWGSREVWVVLQAGHWYWYSR